MECFIARPGDSGAETRRRRGDEPCLEISVAGQLYAQATKPKHVGQACSRNSKEAKEERREKWDRGRALNCSAEESGSGAGAEAGRPDN